MIVDFVSVALGIVQCIQSLKSLLLLLKGRKSDLAKWLTWLTIHQLEVLSILLSMGSLAWLLNSASLIFLTWPCNNLQADG